MLIDDFSISFLLLITCYFFLLFGYLHFSYKPDLLNNLMSFGAMFFVFINVLILYSFMNSDSYTRKYLIPLWSVVLSTPIVLIALVILISTGSVFLYRIKYKNRNQNDKQEKWGEKMNKMSKAKRDTYRKISHVFIFLGLFLVWFIGYSVVVNSIKEWVGMIPDNNNTLELYLAILKEPLSIRILIYDLGWFYYLIFFFFYAFCLFLLANELTRKTQYLSFPFNLLPKLVMSEEEKKSYGTYLYFAIGQMFAAFLCPPMAFFAILGISSIGDLMTSQVGIRWGKRHIKWNSNKTWEGTIAGTITSFLICLFFIGPIWSIIFTIAFFLFDILTNKPIKLSDNLLIPIGCALLYIFLRYYLDLDYFSLVLQFF